ncbi:PREDICTED: uncharacterized protein LOC109585483 isoform X2 [Amphimedon queenslandica]|uniref:Resolvase HTH domain-containing protein n=1 Tax=Amphimedon queenslandica TaxID=400682 RepID=A0AAN0JK34_AMPQE|nr:PREDICTED: uncharacterized protein LOC109585483 isoform X2 [Amphimedon queenslandica]|eukprot:XP_019857141.1 PREDICTED: uncharacterized protein LOC109585483 isoform X2 [Amphimedon queenslandica]
MVELVYRDLLHRDAYSAGTFDSSVLELIRQILRDLELMQSQSSLVISPTGLAASMPGSLGGRPHFDIQKDQLSSLIDSGFTVVQISEIIGVSRRTIFRRMSDFELSIRSTYSDLTDTELDYIIKQIQVEFPACGNKQMMGHLLSRGIRIQQARVRESMYRVDPEGCIDRRIGLMKRRKYKVPGPRYLYHIDGNHKLVRINSSLQKFCSAWNNHPLSSEGCLNPLQLWTAGLLKDNSSLLFEDDNLYGIDWNGPIPLEDDYDRLFVPRIECDIPYGVLRELPSFVPPLSHSENYGIDLYCSALDYINTHT